MNFAWKNIYNDYCQLTIFYTYYLGFYCIIRKNFSFIYIEVDSLIILAYGLAILYYHYIFKYTQMVSDLANGAHEAGTLWTLLYFMAQNNIIGISCSVLLYLWNQPLLQSFLDYFLNKFFWSIVALQYCISL